MGLVPLSTFITGACFTLYTQERLERKRRKREFDKKMTEYVYGPLHRELSLLLEDLRAFQSPTGSIDRAADLGFITKDYRYDLVQEKLRHRFEGLQKRLPLYATLVHEARSATEVYINRDLAKHEIGREVLFQIWAGGQVLSVPIMEPIFCDKTPFDFLTEKGREYGKFRIIVYVGNKSEGEFSNEHKINQISKSILEEVRKESLVQEQRREREHLLKECTSLIELVRQEIVLS